MDEKAVPSQPKPPKEIFGRGRSLILGALILLVGIYSHFNSSWVTMELYRSCETYYDIIQANGYKCPDIWLERCFVGIIIFCFILSLIEYVVLWKTDLRTARMLKFVDLGYFIVSAVLLLVAGSLYITSSVQIKKLFGGKNLLKIIAGTLTLAQSIVHTLIAVQVVKLK